MSLRHSDISEAQFGPRASAYLTSAVHAAGRDLDWLEAQLRVNPVEQLVDVGCGGGHVSYRLSPHAMHVTACDPSAQMLAQVQAVAAERNLSNIAVAQAPAHALPFTDHSIDVVVTRFSAHHWLDVLAGLRDIARVLKVGGRIYVIDVITPPVPLLDTHLQTIELLRDPSHVRDYTSAQWTAMLTEAGFTLGDVHVDTIHIEFKAWIERMQTAPAAVTAIRELISHAPEEVRSYYAFNERHDFTMDTAWLTALR